MPKQADLLNKILRVLVLVVVSAAVVLLILRNINVAGNVLVVIIGFGAVILIHEFGHFIIAKISNIKVEAFSIGFPPTLAGILRTERGYRIRILPGFFAKESEDSDGSLFTFTLGSSAKAGETEYRIGLIPFGGFVKMLGQEDTKEVEKTDDPRSYANKPAGIRMAVIAAGVTFNAVSAIIVFIIAFLIGINQMPPIVGGVIPDSPAEKAGLKAGDEIIEVAGKRDDINFRDVMMAGALSGRDKPIPLKVRHPNGRIEDFSLVAKRMEREIGDFRFFGLLMPRSLTVAKVSDLNSLSKATGLLPDDIINAVNGKAVESYWQMEEVVGSIFAPSVKVQAQRGTETVEAQIALNLNHVKGYKAESESDLAHICSMVPRLRITAVLDAGQTADNKIEIGCPDLKKGDVILAAGEVENPTFIELRQVTAKHEGMELALKILRCDRQGIEKTTTITVLPERPRGGDRALIGIAVVLDTSRPVVAKTIGQAKLEIPRGATITKVNGKAVSDFYDIIAQIRETTSQQITINYRVNDQIAGNVVLNSQDAQKHVTVKSSLSESIPFKPLERLYKATGPINAIGMGSRRTVTFITEALMTLKRLIGGLVSPKNFMGPVGIFALSYQIVTQRPIIYYVYFLGLISAFIGVLNSVPLLPFDGGHILFLLFEKIKGSPISEMLQTIVLYIGLGAVGAFFLYVTFNDIVRSFFS
jgi:regulator of sigma E protease